MTPGKIPNYVRFLPEYLKPLGYRSYHTGKWHMKHVTGEGGVGFDHSYTMMDEASLLHPEPSSARRRGAPKARPGLLQHDRDCRLRRSFSERACARSCVGPVLPLHRVPLATLPLTGPAGRHRPLQRPVHRGLGYRARTQVAAHGQTGSYQLFPRSSRAQHVDPVEHAGRRTDRQNRSWRGDSRRGMVVPHRRNRRNCSAPKWRSMQP